MSLIRGWNRSAGLFQQTDVVWIVLLAVSITTSTTTSAQPIYASVYAAEQGRAPQSTPDNQQKPDTPHTNTQRITLVVKDSTVKYAVQAIARAAGLRLVYDNTSPLAQKRVTTNVTNVEVMRAFTLVLAGTGLVAKLAPDRETVVITKPPDDSRREKNDKTQQDGSIIGRVVDSATQLPLGGATVSILGSALRTVTSGDGRYTFATVPPGSHTVSVRILGYRSAERQVVVENEKITTYNFALNVGLRRLDEVVTTATGPQRRMDLGNDITVLNVDEIRKTAPITTVTDLLQSRVPGLVVLPTSGAPGDPARLRLRGVSSAYSSNDPIIIVDGVRVYYDQTSNRSKSLAPISVYQSEGTAWESGSPVPAPPAPSPLDQIDPNSIETIEVFKGPSASAMYGADAANGVIVIKTRRGKAGATSWSMSGLFGRSQMPGTYPVGYYRFGHRMDTGLDVLCRIQDFACMEDSVVRFQALNQSNLSVLGRGNSSQTSVSVSGGTTTLNYAYTASLLNETGILKLPGYEQTLYREAFGMAPPKWMRRPATNRRWSGTGSIGAALSPAVNLTFTSLLTRQHQQRSSLESAIGALMSSYVDVSRGDQQLIPNFYTRTGESSTNMTNALSATWQPKTWFFGSGNMGLNVISRDGDTWTPRGRLIGPDSGGYLSKGSATSVLGDAKILGTLNIPLRYQLSFLTALGVNYTTTTTNDITTQGRNLLEGSSSFAGVPFGDLRVTDQQRELSVFGWYIEPMLTHAKFSLSTGLRIDGNGIQGTGNSGGSGGLVSRLFSLFPKLGGSWLLSDEKFFPFRNTVNLFRLRAAYGQAGVQPGIQDRYRLYQRSMVWLDGVTIPISSIQTLGNTQIRPERSREFEGGFDADFLESRFTVSVTGYQKTRIDALMSTTLPPSVAGDVTIFQNVGVIRNNGIEVSLSGDVIQTDPVIWRNTLLVSRNWNRVVSLAPGMTSNETTSGRIVPGYPMFGRWARPILGFGDLNGDKVIDTTEVQLGDSLAYLGAPVPNYDASLETSLSLLRGRVTIAASIGYQNGLTQSNEIANVFSRALYDSAAPFAEQAAAVIAQETDYGRIQTVSTLRFRSLSIGTTLPVLGGRSMTVALQGSNLGLRTNYRGKDPNVNAFTSGNTTADTGILPQPRTWSLALRLDGLR